MMRLLKRKSIRSRLIAIIMGVAVVAVGITTFAISLFGVYDLEHSLKQEMELAADIVGERNKYMIKFGKQVQVTSNLEVFKVRPSVRKACIYDKTGNVFAFYPMQPDSHLVAQSSNAFKDATECPLINEEITRFKDDTLQTYRNISLNDKKVGAIYIESDLREVDQYVANQLITAFAVIGMVFMLSYLLALRLQKDISLPILELASAAVRVSSSKDYSYRVMQRKSTQEIESRYTAEIASLVRAFNAMLEEVQRHESELQQNYDELERAKELAESASMAKSQFLASISHELRTPLNAIIGFSTIINSQLFGKIDEKYLEYSKDIYDSGVHLLDVINDILDLSKAEAGKLSLQLDAFDAGIAIEKCVRILSERASNGGVEVKMQLQSDMPEIVADRVRFIQIVLNLLSNAIKFTSEGGVVKIEAYCKDNEPAQKLFYIRVEDDGIGMTQDEIATAFQSFGQIDSGLDRKYEGTGLGLPLTKKLIALHEGTINIYSSPDIGTVVEVMIPSKRHEYITIV